MICIFCFFHHSRRSLTFFEENWRGMTRLTGLGVHTYFETFHLWRQLQGVPSRILLFFFFFDLYFYTLKSQLRYPSFIPFSDLTLSSRGDPQSLRTTLHSKPGYRRTRAENQSHTSPRPQGDTSGEAWRRPANPRSSFICPRENSRLSTL